MSFLSSRIKKAVIEALNDEEVKDEVDEFIRERAYQAVIKVLEGLKSDTC